MSDGKTFDQAYRELQARLHGGANQSSNKIDIWAQYGETPWWNTMPSATAAAAPTGTEQVLVTTDLDAATTPSIAAPTVIVGQNTVVAHPDYTTSAFPEAANQPLTKSLAQLTVSSAPLGTTPMQLVDHTAEAVIEPGVFSRAVAHLQMATQPQGRK